MHRNLDGQSSAGEQHLGAVAVQRRAYRRGNTGLYGITHQFMAEGRPLAESGRVLIRPASRVGTTSCGTASSPRRKRKALIDERRPAGLGTAMPSSSRRYKQSSCHAKAVDHMGLTILALTSRQERFGLH